MSTSCPLLLLFLYFVYTVKLDADRRCSGSESKYIYSSTLIQLNSMSS